MYSIFLVDDEEVELEMMRDFVKWEEMEIYVAGTALNGQDAIEKINAIQPDIILTDVKMPKMNGIELAKLVSERFEWMKIVFLTGHDEFDYVRSALNVGAVGYLLKPLDLDEIAVLMEKVKQKCEEARFQNKSVQGTKSNIVKELMYEKNKERMLNLVASFKRLERRDVEAPLDVTLTLCSVDERYQTGIPIPMDECVARLQLIADHFFREERKEACTAVSLREGELAIIRDAELNGDSRLLWTAFAEAVRTALPCTITIAVGDKSGELLDVNVLYEHARELLSERFYSGCGKVLHAEYSRGSFDSDQLPPFEENELLDTLYQLDREQAEAIVRNYIDKLAQLRIRRRQIGDWAVMLGDRLSEITRTGAETLAPQTGRSEYYHAVYESNTIQDIETIVLEGVSHALNALQERSTDKNSKLVHQVREIIDRTYHEQLTITSLSSQVYLSPNYMRSIFKEKTGMTIHDYLTKIRLEKAKEMLGDASLKVQDIAQRVGYESTSYFISLFLKNQGVTPNEYRKNL